jgi:hypothetical protein
MMLTEGEAIRIATDHLKRRREMEYRFHSASHIPASVLPGRFKVLGDTWVVRFEEVLPPGVGVFGFTVVSINSETGEIVEL